MDVHKCVHALYVRCVHLCHCVARFAHKAVVEYIFSFMTADGSHWYTIQVRVGSFRCVHESCAPSWKVRLTAR